MEDFAWTLFKRGMAPPGAIVDYDGDTRIFQILPAFGAPGACLDYDADCFEFKPGEHANCWLHDPDPTRGACPFID